MMFLAVARKLLCLQISNHVLLKRPKQPFIFYVNHFSVRGKLGVLWGNENGEMKKKYLQFEGNFLGRSAKA